MAFLPFRDARGVMHECIERESEDEMKTKGERSVAKFDTGILNLSLPKKQQANNRAVPIQ